MNPSMVRLNNRYRGPVETFKRNMTQEAVHGDMTQLVLGLDRLAADLGDLRGALVSGKKFDLPVSVSMAEGTESLDGVVGGGKLAHKMGTLRRHISEKGGVVNG